MSEYLTIQRPNIVGNGDIASVLLARPDRLYFASGVSNSQETDESEYNRERALLVKQPKNLRLVYFSSLSIFYSDTRYTRHKLEMESLVREFPSYCIVRLGTITWGKNKHILINFLKERIKNGEPMEIRDETRYVIEKQDLDHWMNLIPDFNCEMNIPGQMMTIKDIVKKYVL